MSAQVLRQAAALMRADRPSPFCECDNTDHWFDRSICPEPCGSMHDICVECGRVQDRCPIAAESATPSDFDLALADWLDYEAGEIPPQANTWMGQPLSEAPAIRVANAYLANP